MCRGDQPIVLSVMARVFVRLTRVIRRTMLPGADSKVKALLMTSFIVLCVLVRLRNRELDRSSENVRKSQNEAPRRIRKKMIAPRFPDQASLARHLNLTPEDYDSLLYRVNILEEMNLATDGDPFSPLEGYKSRCWKSKYKRYDPTYYTKNKLLKTIPSYCIQGERAEQLVTNYTQIIRHRLAAGEKSRLRCLPYLYVIGVSKGGTTDLVTQLVKHPDIVVPIFKENFWWDVRRLGNGGPSYTGYIDTYDPITDEIRDETLVRHGRPYHPRITVDGTSTYLYHTQGNLSLIPGNQNQSEPRYLLIHSLRLLQPEARFVVLLREPGERLYSNFRMLVNPSSKDIPLEEIPLTFHRNVLRFIHTMTRCFSARTVRACAYDVSLENPDYRFILRSSFYYIFVSDWLSVYPRDQVLILRSEDYFADRRSSLLRIYSHVGLDPPPPDILTDIEDSQAENRNNHTVVNMLPQTRRTLSAFFKPYNLKLAELLHDSRYTWSDILEP